MAYKKPVGKAALLSVYNKEGIAQLGRVLKEAGYTIISTPGTGKRLARHRISYLPASEVTRNPGGLTDCIQTISYRIQAGILFDRANQQHLKRVKELSLQPIDLVVCNFPPLKKVVKDFTLDFNIRNVDVGGPLMTRAAAINYRHVLIVVDPQDYPRIGKAIANGKITEQLRLFMARKAFKYTSRFDQAIARYLKAQKASVETGSL